MTKRKNSEPLNRWVALIFSLVAIFLGTLFTSQLIFDKPISREEATEVIGTFKDFEGQQKLKGGFSEVSLFFTDEHCQYIDSSCVSEELLQLFEKIPKGTEMYLLVNPNNGYVVELVADGNVLLEFNYAQKAIERDSILGLYLGFFLYASAIAFIVQAVLDFKKKIKREKIKKERLNSKQ